MVNSFCSFSNKGYQLITKVLQKARVNLRVQLKNSENNIAVYLKENYDTTVIQKMLSEYMEMEGKLFNHRVTKFIKIMPRCWFPSTATSYENWFWIFKLSKKHVTVQKNSNVVAILRKIKNTPFEEAVDINNTQNADTEHIDNSQRLAYWHMQSSTNPGSTKNEHKLTGFEKILANLIKNKIPPALNIIEQDLVRMVKHPKQPTRVKSMKNVIE